MFIKTFKNWALIQNQRVLWKQNSLKLRLVITKFWPRARTNIYIFKNKIKSKLMIFHFYEKGLNMELMILVET